MSFYLKQTYVDNEPGIELVNIQYTWTPMNTPPNWEAHRETRVMPRGGTLIRGMGGTTLDEHGQSVQTTTNKIELPDDGVRRKILSLPQDVHDPSTGRYEEHYLFHHFFEVFRNGQRDYSPLFTEEIVTREVEFVFYDDGLSGGCIYWSLEDWDTPQYTPIEEHNFVPVTAKTTRSAHTNSTDSTTRRPSTGSVRKWSGRFPYRAALEAW